MRSVFRRTLKEYDLFLDTTLLVQDLSQSKPLEELKNLAMIPQWRKGNVAGVVRIPRYIRQQVQEEIESSGRISEWWFCAVVLVYRYLRTAFKRGRTSDVVRLYLASQVDKVLRIVSSLEQSKFNGLIDETLELVEFSLLETNVISSTAISQILGTALNSTKLSFYQKSTICRLSSTM